ncbi:uncharacterized protein LOC120084038 [Benincasa hispida]|uniref:uncharacterized protein LOC120084038 n=1 Tax=Benincasa hispida TaxID=102211 RepID=UPI0018FFF6A1|nr:uncharacterized protein LOC120084038 [Benincasa hispida]
MDSYESTMVYDAESNMEIRLSEFMDGEGGWRWLTESCELLEIWGLIQTVGPRVRGEDYWVWVSGASGWFSITSAWESLHSRCPRVSWSGLLWSRSGIPRHLFCVWLAVRDRLGMWDWLRSWGVLSKKGVFCIGEVESQDLLFFECGFER